MSKLFFMCVSAIYILILSLIYYKNVADDEKRMKEFYNANNQLLIKKMKEAYDEKMETDKRLREIEERAKEAKDNGGFDWNTPLPADGVTRQLRAN